MECAPTSSILIDHPRMVEILEEFGLAQVTINMSDFAGATRKPTLLFSSHGELLELNPLLDGWSVHEPKRKKLATRTMNACGTKIHTTGNKNLKKSQHYPMSFGRAVVRYSSSVSG